VLYFHFRQTQAPRLKTGPRLVCFSLYLPPLSPSVTRNVLSPRMELTSSGGRRLTTHPKFLFQPSVPNYVSAVGDASRWVLVTR
jgi:hypothetical protein